MKIPSKFLRFSGRKSSQNWRIRLKTANTIYSTQTQTHTLAHTANFCLERLVKKRLTIAGRDNTEEWVDIIKDHLWFFLQQQYQILRDETDSSADSRQKRKRSLLSLCHTPNQNTHTHTKTHTEAVSGTTEVLWVAVSQTLFLDGRINSRPSLPRHSRTACCYTRQSRRSHLLCQTLSLHIHSFSHSVSSCYPFSPLAKQLQEKIGTTPSIFVLIN